MATASGDTGLAKTTTDKITKRDVINLDALEPEVRKRVVGLTNELQKNIQEFGASGLKIGKTLKELEIILKPRQVWVPYLNSLPGFSQVTAYRYMNAYEIAQEKFPKVILDRVLATGMPMIGDKNSPYGKYTDTVKKLPMPPADCTEAVADRWLSQVQEQYKAGRKGARAKVLDPDTMMKEAYNGVLKRYAKVPKDSQIYWVKKLFSFILGNIGLPDMTIEAKTPPSNFGDTVESEEAQETESTEQKKKGKKKTAIN